MFTRLLILISAGLLAIPSAFAGSVACRTGAGCLNGTDFFDWTDNFGPEYTTILNGSTATSNSTLITALVNFAGGGDGGRRDEGTSWVGNFTPGDELLWTNWPGQGPLTFTFSQAITGVGANIQADWSGAFTAFLQLYDSSSNLVWSFAEAGNSSSSEDGSAIFIGLADMPAFTTAVFSLTYAADDLGDFAINQMDITTGSEVPEPALGLPLAVALMGMAAVRRRARRS